MINEERLAAEASIAELEALFAQQSAYIRELEGGRQRSSRPPSNNDLALNASKTKNLRRKSGRKPGGQPGHRGVTLRLVATPDTVVEHRPAICSACQAQLGDEVVVLGYECRQV